MDGSDVEYTIAICNYEMADTLRESLKSVLSQVDDRFEVLVVDDGSADGSVEILRSLEHEHENFRLYQGNNDNLAEARNCSFRQARGRFVIESMDADDRYRPVVQDFVRIYHALEDARDGDFYLWGRSINMAPRRLLLEYPYRSLGYGEDKDFWRRLAAAKKLVLLDHASPCVSIGYDREADEMLDIWLETATVEFQTGITVPSFVWYNVKEAVRGRTINRREALFNALIWPLAYLKSQFKPRYAPIDGFERFGQLKEFVQSEKRTLPELEAKYGFELDRAAFGNAGYDVFVAYAEAAVQSRENS